MSQQEFIGTLFMSLVPVFAIIAYFAKGAWALSQSITELKKAIEFVEENFYDNKKQLEMHRDIISNHETRISVLENKD